MVNSANSGMDSLIRLVNQLQDAQTQLRNACPGLGSLLTFELPQIAVVGSQSAGKSSVLENFVGKDFLPRGSGIVTRRPLVLQLILDQSSEHGEFLHRKGEIFRDFDEIRREIQRETDRVTGSNKGISPIPINLRIHSPHVLDLTLVDLPGMTKVPVGDQPPDIEHQLRDMILTYVSNPNCIILAVTAANSDLANSDALRMARDVDPSGSRTIGVLTKLDLMDQGTDAREVLENKVYPLRYGFIGIVNRSQRDIDANKRIDAAVEAERRFFLQHPAYRAIADRMGTPYLQTSLNQHLTRHIVQTLPTLRGKLYQQSLDLENQLEHYRRDVNYDDPSWKSKALVLEVMKFAQTVKASLLGHSDLAIAFDRLSFGAQIRHLFHIKYPLLLTDVQFTDEDTLKREIGFSIQNIIGCRTGIFTPDKAFDHVIRKQIVKMKSPSMELLDQVAGKVIEAINSAIKDVERYPALAQELESLARCFALTHVEETRAQICMLLDMELAYINAKHEDFVGFSYVDQQPGTVRSLRKIPQQAVVHKGWLTVGNTGIFRDRACWFVLTCDSISWYRDESENDRFYSIMVDPCIKFMDCGKANRFVLVHNRAKNIYKDQQRLELVAGSLEEMEKWKVKLLDVGIYPKADAGEMTTANDGIEDPHLQWQIETIWVLVESYLRIVRRNLQDMVPKAIVHSLIRRCATHYEQRLVADVSQSQRCEDLMQENESDALRRKQLQQAYECCKRALTLISGVDLPKIKEYTVAPAPLALKSAPVAPPPIPKRPQMVPPRPRPLSQSESNPDIKVPPRPLHLDNNRKISAGSIMRGTKQNISLRKAIKSIDSSQKSAFYVD